LNRKKFLPGGVYFFSSRTGCGIQNSKLIIPTVQKKEPRDHGHNPETQSQPPMAMEQAAMAARVVTVSGR
jgi:hypothetical protein